MTAGTCSGCAVPMFSQYAWAKIPLDERAGMVAAGTGAKHSARGLCNKCYKVAEKNDLLLDIPRRSVPLEDVVEEWEHADLDRELSKSHRIRHLAPRLGMTVKGLEKALLKAGIAA